MLDGREEAGIPPMCMGIVAFVLRPAGGFVKRCPAPPPTELKPACELLLLLLLLLPMSADDEASGAGRRAVPLNPGEDTTRA
jgi:hypothetical protein